MITLEIMPPLMFGGLIVFMLIGYPVAFSLAAVGFFFGFLSIDFGYFTLPFMQAIPGRVFGSILSNVLIIGGRVRGSWRRTLTRGAMAVEVRLLDNLTPTEEAAVEEAGGRLARFHGASVTLTRR